ncbi:MAG TPA: hypothetical protein H9867_07295 [Candidatus Corynebacterium gallistercoris]|uniref:Secreted protein n=1 Tax=Candidatus Corynebacterium gallistercoris TaxID=2838530 RepID=A0A9D1URF9_9CORY|nr:hypothetical protein [Candidatus Corynebacterium gallistercoris]
MKQLLTRGIASVSALIFVTAGVPVASADVRGQALGWGDVSVQGTTGAQRQDKMVDDLANGFEVVFTEVVMEVSPGEWQTNYESARRYGISDREADELIRIMEADGTTAGLDKVYDQRTWPPMPAV